MPDKCSIQAKTTGKFKYHIQPATFWISTILIVGFVVWGERPDAASIGGGLGCLVGIRRCHRGDTRSRPGD